MPISEAVQLHIVLQYTEVINKVLEMDADGGAPQLLRDVAIASAIEAPVLSGAAGLAFDE